MTHPDSGGDEFQFEVLQEAYNVLSDPTRKARHDRELLAANTTNAVAKTDEQGRTVPTPLPRDDLSAADWIETLVLYAIVGIVWLVASTVAFVLFDSTIPRVGAFGLGALALGVAWVLGRIRVKK